MAMIVALGRQASAAAARVLMAFQQPSQHNLTPALCGAGAFEGQTPSLRQKVSEIWDGVLNAVPKNRTSFSKKRLGRQEKYMRRIQSFATCSKCNKKHMNHHLCPWCFPFNNWIVNKERNGDLPVELDFQGDPIIK